MSPSSLKELYHTFICITQLQSCKFKDQMDLLSVCKLNRHSKQFAGVPLPDSMARLNYKVFSESYCFLHYFSQNNEPITGCLSLHFLSRKIETTKQSKAIFLIWSIHDALFEPGGQEVHPSSLCSLSIMHVHNMHIGTQIFLTKGKTLKILLG